MGTVLSISASMQDQISGIKTIALSVIKRALLMISIPVVYTDQTEHTARRFSAWLPLMQCTLSGLLSTPVSEEIYLFPKRYATNKITVPLEYLSRHQPEQQSIDRSWHKDV